MNKVWFDGAWEDYLYWQVQDRKTLKKINALLRDIERDNFGGIGKPEPKDPENLKPKRPRKNADPTAVRIHKVLLSFLVKSKNRIFLTET